MTIWKQATTVAALNALSANTLVAHLGIECIEIGADYLKAKMHVDHRTVQPFGLLHGGASIALAETLASVAAHLCEDMERRHCVGLTVNAHHIRTVGSGYVIGTARPLHRGRSTHLWDVTIHDEAQHLVCTVTVTMAILDKPRPFINANVNRVY